MVHANWIHRSLVRRVIVAVMASLLFGLSGPIQAEERALTVAGGSPAPNLYYSLIFIAEEVGFFRDEGLTVSVEFAPGATVAVQMVASGQADLGKVAIEPVITGHDKGIAGKIFYQDLTKLIFAIATPADGPIESLEQLAGKRIGVAGMGSAAIEVARSQLTLAGVDPEQVQFLPVGIGAQAATAIDGGHVDALALWGIAYAALESEGFSFSYFRHPVLGDIGNAGYFASDDFIRQNREAVAGFARAIAKATAFLFANPEAALRIYWKHNPAAKGDVEEEAALRRGLREVDAVMRELTPESGGKFGLILEDEWQEYIKFILAGQDEFVVPPVNELMTNEFIDEANDFDVQKVEELARGWQAN